MEVGPSCVWYLFSLSNYGFMLKFSERFCASPPAFSRIVLKLGFLSWNHALFRGARRYSSGHTTRHILSRWVRIFLFSFLHPSDVLYFTFFLRCAGWVKWLMYYTCIHIPHIRPWTWNGGENVQRVHSGSLKIPSLADGVCSVVALLRKWLVTFMSHHCPTGFSTIFFLANSRKKESQLGYFSVTTGANRRVAM